MGGDGERGKAWLRARGHHLCLTDTIFFLFFFLRGGGGGSRRTGLLLLGNIGK